MALGRKDGQNNSNLVFLSPRGKKDGKEIEPQFFIRRKVGDKYQEDGSTDRFSGTLSKIQHKTVAMVAPAAPLEVISITLDDAQENERYIAEFTFKVPTRSLFNRILNLQKFDNVEISYFRNKDGWEAFALRQDGQTITAKYEKGDPAIPEVEVTKKKNGTEDKDYFEVNKFFQEKMVEFGQAIERVNSGSSKQEAVKSNQDEDCQKGSSGDDIPF